MGYTLHPDNPRPTLFGRAFALLLVFAMLFVYWLTFAYGLRLIFTEG